MKRTTQIVANTVTAGTTVSTMVIPQQRLLVQRLRIGVDHIVLIVIVVIIVTGWRRFEPRTVNVQVFVVQIGENLGEILHDFREGRSFMRIPIPALSHQHVSIFVWVCSQSGKTTKNNDDKSKVHVA